MGLLSSMKEKGISRLNSLKKAIATEENAENILDNFKKKEESRALKKEDFYVVGVHYYINNINKLATCNPDWKSTCKTLANKGLIRKKVYRYNYVNRPVKLIEEPQNPNDKNAVMVIIAGEHIGYISRDDNKHIKEILQKSEIKYISAFISGGQYKIISPDYKIDKDEERISINIRIAYV